MIAKITIIQMAYCVSLKKKFCQRESDPSTLRQAQGSGTAKLTTDDHTLADGAEIAVLVSQGKAIKINP